MSKYIHSFNVSFPISFHSNHREFDDAFEEWADSFPTEAHLRSALLDYQDDLKTLFSSVEWWATWSTTPTKENEPQSSDSYPDRKGDLFSDEE